MAGWMGPEAEVISSEEPLLGGDTAWLSPAAFPALPWGPWFDTLNQSLIYRPRDRFTPKATVALLSSIGGKLAASHLLIIDSVYSRVRPWSRSSHRGSYRLSYRLALWNVAKGQPEWALSLQFQGPKWSDLNAPLEPRLDAAMQDFRRTLPERLKAFWQKEPR